MKKFALALAVVGAMSAPAAAADGMGGDVPPLFPIIGAIVMIGLAAGSGT